MIFWPQISAVSMIYIKGMEIKSGEFGGVIQKLFVDPVRWQWQQLRKGIPFKDLHHVAFKTS
jgi:hypothetical protein